MNMRVSNWRNARSNCPAPIFFVFLWFTSWWVRWRLPPSSPDNCNFILLFLFFHLFFRIRWWITHISTVGFAIILSNLLTDNSICMGESIFKWLSSQNMLFSLHSSYAQTLHTSLNLLWKKKNNYRWKK